MVWWRWGGDGDGGGAGDGVVVVVVGRGWRAGGGGGGEGLGGPREVCKQLLTGVAPLPPHHPILAHRPCTPLRRPSGAGTATPACPSTAPRSRASPTLCWK